MLCQEGGGFFTIITVLVLEASSVLSTPALLGELEEKGCICPFVS